MFSKTRIYFVIAILAIASALPGRPAKASDMTFSECMEIMEPISGYLYRVYWCWKHT